VTPVAPGSIAAVKRIPAGIVAVLAVLATGAAASACNVTPSAATVNGDTIAVSTLNTELDGLSSTLAGQCLLSLNFPQLLDLTSQGAGGTGTYKNGFAGLVLGNNVDNLLGRQYMASVHAQLTPQEVTAAQSTFTTVLDGAITAQSEQAASVGGTAGCAQANGSPFTGKTLLAALPAGLRQTELANQAVEQYLLTRGADLSNSAVLAYYLANPTEFVQDCVSAIQTTDQATADAAYNAMKSGTSFADAATAASADPSAAARSGELGCFPESTVLSQLQQESVTVGQPITPIQSSGTWEVFVVTSQTPISLDQASASIRKILTQTTANQARVSAEVQAFARASSVDINPQYGTWAGSAVTPPTPPATRYLLPFYGSTISTTTTTTAPTNPSSTNPSATTTPTTTTPTTTTTTNPSGSAAG
jgi:hypothetical protein